MKRAIVIPTTLVVLFITFLATLGPSLQGQTYQQDGGGNSLRFGNDIVINNQPLQDQKNVVVRSAFNGWLYAGYSYIEESTQWPRITILKSIDNGISWTVLIDFFEPIDNSEIKSLDFCLCGDSASNLKIVLTYLFGSISSGAGSLNSGVVLRFNANNGTYENVLLPLGLFRDLAIAYDLGYPAMNSNPYSVGCLFSTPKGNQDTLDFRCSSNGGNSFDYHQGITKGQVIPNVSLSFGRSLSANSGRYFATWIESVDAGSQRGHLYTAHTEPFFNSGFTEPVMIDSLVPDWYNSLQNPRIACQVSDYDNDSADLTGVIVFEKYVSSSVDSEIHGVYNNRLSNSNYYFAFTPGNTTDRKKSPSIIFNPSDSAFSLSFYNLTTQKLPLYRKNLNFQQPSIWTLVTSGYNDNASLIDPKPSLTINAVFDQEAVAWSGTGSAKMGLALFDALYLITGEGVLSNNNEIFDLKSWPNPGSDRLTVSLRVLTHTQIRLCLYTITGEPVSIMANQVFQPGINYLELNCANLANGQYFIEACSKDQSVLCFVIISH